jgi:hypothetical protein
MSAYITHRVLPAFQASLQEAGSDASKMQAAVDEGLRQVEIWERQSVIYGLYERPLPPIVVGLFSAQPLCSRIWSKVLG